jgi:hypothetical protein
VVWEYPGKSDRSFTLMKIDPVYLELSFEKAGIRNSQKRLKGLIGELAAEPLKVHQDALNEEFALVQEIVLKRVAAIIAYWCQNKHDPVAPSVDDLMSDITNSRRSDVSLAEFYSTEVTNAMHSVAPIFNFVMPDTYTVSNDELEFALLELEEVFEREGIVVRQIGVEPEVNDRSTYDYDYPEVVLDMQDGLNEADFTTVTELVAEVNPLETTARVLEEQREITVVKPRKISPPPAKEVSINVLNIAAREAWDIIYGLMGFESEYIQEKMTPRWQQNPDNFNQDRRFLYNLFIQAIQNAAGVPSIAGNFYFTGQQMTIDQMWQAYYTDLSQRIGPQLAAARFENVANETWYRHVWRVFTVDLRKISPIWLLALVIALVFDGLTTYVSLDQTPMDGMMVALFTLLITALFQIADLLVINYRQREFEADAMSAKYSAKFEQLSNVLAGLQTSSDSYVQFSLERSQAQADSKAAEDSRKMSRRGRFWSARIADINIIVTAYGFAFLFLNSSEPMYALFEQLEIIFVDKNWEAFNLWVFLMIGLSITVSFVINTAQRTEILSWSMRRLKKEA